MAGASHTTYHFIVICVYKLYLVYLFDLIYEVMKYAATACNPSYNGKSYYVGLTRVIQFGW